MAAASAPDLDDRVCKDVPTPPRGPFPREKLFQAHNGIVCRPVQILHPHSVPVLFKDLIGLDPK
jgi:hypothetical protein